MTVAVPLNITVKHYIVLFQVCPESPERSFGARRWKRHRATRLSEEEEENEVEAEKENNRVVEEEQKEEAREESGMLDNADGGQSETYVVLSSPETKDEQVVGILVLVLL